MQPVPCIRQHLAQGESREMEQNANLNALPKNEAPFARP
jgi:hypothetical protein